MIYLDNNATTAVDPQVAALVLKSMADGYGNPSSIHALGRQSRAELIKAKDLIAAYLKVKPEEIIFTSSGTEALNMLIQGFLSKKNPIHIISSEAEHAAVHSLLKAMEKQGHSVTFLRPGLWGAVSVEAVEEAIQSNTKLIVLMSVNNETGVKTDIQAIANLAERRDLTFYVDAIALLGKEPIVIPSGVSAMAFSGHKCHAPKGIGFAFLRSCQKLSPLIIGGEQEAGKRGGTENIPGIIGLAEAIKILQKELPEASKRMERLRNKLENLLMHSIPKVKINGEGPRVVNTSNLAFPTIDGESLLMMLDQSGIAVSHGSACSSGALEPSRVLLAMGIPFAQAKNSVRFSLSRMTTEEEIERAAAIISQIPILRK